MVEEKQEYTYLKKYGRRNSCVIVKKKNVSKKCFGSILYDSSTRHSVTSSPLLLRKKEEQKKTKQNKTRKNHTEISYRGLKEDQLKKKEDGQSRASRTSGPPYQTRKYI